MKSLRLKIYLFLIFSEFILLYPLFIVMFADAGALTALQISSLLIVWSLAILVAEVPSGALADRYSRRNLLVVGQVIRASGYAVWLFFPHYYGFLVGLILWGIGQAFKSGAFEALVYDELKSVNSEKHYAEIMGRGESLSLFFGLASTLAATLVFIWFGYKGVLIGSIAAVLLSAVVAFTLPHRPRQKEVEAPRYLELIRSAARTVAHTPALLKFILFGVFIGMLFRIFDEYASLIIKQSGVSVEWVPVVSALVFLPVILIGFVAYRFEKLRGTTFVKVLLLAGAMLMIAAALGNLTSLVFFSLFMLLLKLTQIIFGAKVQHSIAGQARATITSVSGFGVEVAALGGFFLFGLMSQLGGPRLAFGLFGAGSIVAAIVYLAFNTHKQHKTQQ